MREEILKKIDGYKDMMSKIEKGSEGYEYYRLRILDLERELLMPRTIKLKVHEVPEICESCQ